MQAAHLYVQDDAGKTHQCTCLRVFSCIVPCWNGRAVLRDDSGSVINAHSTESWIDVTAFFEGVHVGLSLIYRDILGCLRVGTVCGRFMLDRSPLLRLESGRVVERLQKRQLGWTFFSEVLVID